MIGIVREYNESRVARRLAVQPDEIPPVIGQNGSAEGRRPREHVGVGYFLIGPTVRLGGQNLMAEPNKLVDERRRYVFVGIQGGHASPGTADGRDLAFHFCRGGQVHLPRC